MSFRDFARRVGPLPTSGMASADPLPPEQCSAPPPTLAEAVEVIEALLGSKLQHGRAPRYAVDFLKRAKGRHG